MQGSLDMSNRRGCGRVRNRQPLGGHLHDGAFGAVVKRLHLGRWGCADGYGVPKDWDVELRDGKIVMYPVRGFALILK